LIIFAGGSADGFIISYFFLANGDFFIISVFFFFPRKTRNASRKQVRPLARLLGAAAAEV